MMLLLRLADDIELSITLPLRKSNLWLLGLLMLRADFRSVKLLSFSIEDDRYDLPSI